MRPFELLTGFGNEPSATLRYPLEAVLLALRDTKTP